jgi:hypothetical protein
MTHIPPPRNASAPLFGLIHRGSLINAGGGSYLVLSEIAKASIIMLEPLSRGKIGFNLIEFDQFALIEWFEYGK